MGSSGEGSEANNNVRFPDGQAGFPGSRAVDCAARGASL